MPSLPRPAGVLLAVLASAIVSAPAGEAQAPAGGAPLRLTAARSETGWISLTVTGAPDGALAISERSRGRDRVVARMALRGGTGTAAHAVAWRCDRRERRFAA